MSRLNHHFETSEHFQQCYTTRLHAVRESGILDFRPGFGESANPLGATGNGAAQRPRRLAPLRKLISVNSLICAIIIFTAVGGNLFASPANGKENANGAAKSEYEQKRFASPEDAIKALTDAVESGDHTAVREIFGSDATNMLTGDKVQDAENFKAFAKAVSEKCDQEKKGDNEIILAIGSDNWPFPIPLVKQSDGQWIFDTDAGAEEIINRHIGQDELYAIGVCHSFLEAENTYYSLDAEGDGVHQYAEKFKSGPNKHDGLYWPTEAGQQPSPLGELVEQAHAEGYHGRQNPGKGPAPFHGYYFKILKCQGPDAPGGKMDYVEHRKMVRGFALVAYPERWNQSGVMTFIVGKDGQVYQKDLGEKSRKLGSEMERYDPGDGWTVVHDDGITDKDTAK